LWTLLAAIGLTAALWAFLLTPLGLDAAARVTEKAITLGSGMQARIEDVSGVFPFSLRVGRFALADAEGPWLVIGDARLSWSPGALFTGRVLVRELTADVVRIRRAPHLPPRQDQPVRIEWPPQLPSRPPILVDRLAVDRLILDKELAGQAAILGINGTLAESDQGAVTLTLDAARLDGDKPLSLRLAATLHFAQWRLAANASLEDAPGGLLASPLAGDGPAGPLVVALTGDGPLDAWKGRLTAALSQKPFLTADLGLAVPLEKNAMAAFSLNATVSPPPGLLPEQTARALGPAPSCAIAGRLGIASGAFFLDRADLTVAAGNLTATGSLDPEKDVLAATARLTVPDASRLDQTLGGKLAATLTATGNVTRPRLEVQLGGTGGRAGPLAVDACDITTRIEFLDKLDGLFPGATLAISGTFSGLTGPEKTTLLGEKLALSLDATIDANGGLSAKSGVLAGKGGTLALRGLQWKKGQTSGSIALDVADVAGTASLVGVRLAGGLTATADVTADETATGEAALSVSLKNLTAQPPAEPGGLALVALLGASPKLSAKAAFSPAGVRLSELTLDGKAASLAATGSFDAKTTTLTAKAMAKIPDLAVLGPALGPKCGGALTCAVDLSGPADAPRIAVKATAERLGYGDLALTEATLESAITDVAGRPSGQARLTARRDGETARLETSIALAGSRLTVKDLRLTAPDAVFTGEAVCDTATGRVAGKLSGNASNLAGLGRFMGLSLAGGLKLSVTAAAPGTGRAGQTLTGELTAANLRLPGLNVAGLTVSANLDDVTGQPRGRATLSGKGLATEGASLSTLSLEAVGDGRSLAFSASTKGTVSGETPLALAAKASLTGTQRSHTITVASLSGTLGKAKFALTAPAALSFGDGTSRLDGLALSYDKALVTASGSLGSNETTAKATVAHFPLPLLAAFGLAGVDGTGTLAATLSGSPAKPNLAADIRLDGLRLVSEKGQGVPPIGLAASVNASGGKCSLKASLAGKNKKEAATIDAAIPLHFALAPFTLDMPAGGALSGRITADSDLSDLATLLAQANTRLVGRLTADLTLGGALAAPSVTGSLTLAASRLENADAGIVFRNLDIRAEASGGVLTIAKGTGEDGKGGSFAITGKIGIADPEHGPIDLSMRLTRLRVAGLDMATVTADGELAVTGTLSRMRAAGAITLGPVDINLPNSLPPDVVVIPVTLVNDPNAPKKAKKPTQPAVARHIDLDCKVTLGQMVHVRGMGLDSRWGGQVTVTGTAAAPTIIGKFVVEKGRIDLLGSSLDITKGEVSFLGATPPAPILDIRGETTANDITAGISITGDATAPAIALTSTPTLPHDEILSRLLFGQSATTLSPIQAAQLAQAAASLYTGGTPTNILARTRRILGLDQLTLVTGASGISSTVLRAGKEIVKGVNVGVEQGTGAQSGAVSVEVQVTPNITVDSRVGTDNKQGVGVNWKWDY
jgi:translocation and assembly module TamB